MNTRISSLPYFTTFYYHLCSIGGGCLELPASGWVRRTNSRRKGGDCKGIFLPQLPPRSQLFSAGTLPTASLSRFRNSSHHCPTKTNSGHTPSIKHSTIPCGFLGPACNFVNKAFIKLSSK